MSMTMTSCRPCSTGSELRLRAYAHRRKSLTVDTQKSEVMCFNSRSDNCLPPFYYDGTQLSYTDTFKYLGKEMPLNLQLELNMYRS